MEAMHTAYAKSGTCSQRVSNWVEASIVKGKRALFVTNVFAESFNEGGKGAFEMSHLFLYFFSLEHISQFVYANFLPTCNVVYAYPQN